MTITPVTTTRSAQSKLPPSKANNLAPSLILPVRERILVYGREGTGKTKGWISAAEMWPDAQFFVLDTDDSVARMLENNPLPNVHVYIPDGWGDLDRMCDEIIAQTWDIARNLKQPIRKEDLPWIIVDFADATWDMVQNYYTEQVFNQGIDDFFLQARQQQANKRNEKKLQPLEGWTDWQVINKIFQTRWNSLTKGGGPFHLYITARAVEVGEGLEVKSLYKALHRMPGGEKRMGGRVHTVLMASVDQDGWYLSSAKDRERQLLNYNKSSRFSISYLMKIAGWQP